jgi:hypothetical protein
MMYAKKIAEAKGIVIRDEAMSTTGVDTHRPGFFLQIESAYSAPACAAGFGVETGADRPLAMCGFAAGDLPFLTLPPRRASSFSSFKRRASISAFSAAIFWSSTFSAFSINERRSSAGMSVKFGASITSKLLA